MHTPDSYYLAALAAQNLTPKREKIAETVPAERLKLARLYWANLINDGIEYANPNGPAEDAMSLATHYAAYKESHVKTAEAKAAEITAKFAELAASLVEGFGGKLTAEDILKIAAAKDGAQLLADKVEVF